MPLAFFLRNSLIAANRYWLELGSVAPASVWDGRKHRHLVGGRGGGTGTSRALHHPEFQNLVPLYYSLI